jgi:NADH:ubiquinone oxidoreductase subunit 3 (subunit A)
MKDLQTSPAERKRARHLHAALLFNLVVNHIFLFLMALTFIKTSSIPMILMAVFSLTLLGYILISAKRSLTSEPSWFIRCHWQFAAKRARLFLILFLVLGSLSVAFFYGGHAIGMKAVAITAFSSILGLVFMVAVLGLVVMEFDAEHQSKDGKVPAGALAHYPLPEGNV